MKRKLQFLVATMLIACMLSTTCFAADVETMNKTNSTSSTTVTVDTTKTSGAGGSLPDSFAYTVTVPAAILLKPENNDITSLDGNVTFGNNESKVTLKGTAGAGQCVTISIASNTAGDSGTSFSLVKENEPDVKTNGGSFYIGSVGNSSFTANSKSDKSTMLTAAGLQKDLVITGVKGVTDYGVYEGGLTYTISVGADPT